MRLALLLGVFCCSILFAQQSILLKEKILQIPAEGISIIGSGITVDQAKEFALNDAKRNALESAGTYLESHTEVLNNMTQRDEIITFSGTMLKMDKLDYLNELVDNQFAIKAKICITIDTELLNKRIEDIRSNNAYKEMLEAEKERNDKLTARIKELQNSKNYGNQAEAIAKSLQAGDWFNKGVDARLIEELDEAIKCYSKAIELDNGFGYAYNNRGTVYFDKKNYSKAESDLKMAVQNLPDDAYPYFNLGMIYFKMKYKQSAVDNLKKFLDKQKKSDDDTEKVKIIINELNK